MKTVYQLLCDAPDSQAIRMKNAFNAAGCGIYSDVVFYLSNAAREEGDTPWARDALDLADYYQGENFVAIESLAAEIERDSNES